MPYRVDVEGKLERASLRGKRVLLADANTINQQLTADALRAAGMDVDIAENGEVAVNMAEIISFDAVLLSCQMSVMDGFQAARHMRVLRDERTLPIIAMSSQADVDTETRCHAAGINTLLAKPLNPHALYDALELNLFGKVSAESARQAKPAQAASNADEDQNLREAGLDLDTGLAMTSGHRQTYFEHLRTFVERHRDDGQRLLEAFESDDLDAARQMAHGLKGVSANLGAQGISQLAKQLEQALRHGDDAAFREAIAALGSAFSGIQRALDQLKPRTRGPVPNENSLPLENMASDLSKLARLIRHFDVEAVKQSEQLLSQLNETDSSAFLPTLDALRTFDFDAANIALTRLAGDRAINIAQ